MKDSWFDKSGERRTALEQGIKNHESNDVIVPYPDVAFAFPSKEPNPSTFDFPLIDQNELLKWAAELNLEVSKAPEKRPEGHRQNPPVRFKKKTA